MSQNIYHCIYKIVSRTLKSYSMRIRWAERPFKLIKYVSKQVCNRGILIKTSVSPGHSVYELVD